jgi:hypothetical protein
LAAAGGGGAGGGGDGGATGSAATKAIIAGTVGKEAVAYSKGIKTTTVMIARWPTTDRRVGMIVRS